MSRIKTKPFFRLSLAVLALVLISLGAWIWQKNHNKILPESITKQVDFAIMVPSQELGGFNKGSVKYDGINKLLSFKVIYEGANLVVSEQAFPDQFVDVPTAYDKFLEQLPTYTSFDAINGHVHLAEPTNLHGLTLAVMDGKGTFIFVKPDKKISESDWRKFFNSMDVIK